MKKLVTPGILLLALIVYMVFECINDPSDPYLDTQMSVLQAK